MRRVLVVVATFVALNTGGFWAYRALQPEPAAASAPAASDETFSREPESIQPKSTEIVPEVVPTPVENDSANSLVSEPTISREEEAEEVRDEEQPVKRAPTRRVRRATPTPTPKQKTPAVRPAEQSNSGIQNPVLEMDDNPYKRGE